MPETFFNQRIAEVQENLKKLESRSSRLAVLRLAIFLSGVIGFVYLINQRDWPLALIFLSVGAILFVLVLLRHLKVRFDRRHNELLIEINKEELKRLSRDLTGLKTGDQFQDKDHPYSSDLDLFGENSLFQFLNRTSSSLGEKLLSDRLREGIAPDKAVEIQKAVGELAKTPLWLQRFHALGRHQVVEEDDLENLFNWAQSPSVILQKQLLKIVSIVSPIALLVLGYFIWYLDLSYVISLPLVLLHAVLLIKNHSYAKETVESTYRSISVLKSFQHQMIAITELSPEEASLKKYVDQLSGSNKSAEKLIGKLKYLLSQLEVRNNLLHGFFNLFFLLDIHWLRELETWREKHANDLENWLTTVAELEYLGSLAATLHANPSWQFARFSEIEYTIEGHNLTHPLLLPEKSVSNDFNFQNAGEVVLLTGPNMAGKSTFLRSVAINIVMARMGAPVCARRFKIDPKMQVYTAMRVADALSENVSSFYAEIHRIGQLLERIKKGERVLYFLDEILKGTNSADRHKGAEGLIRQLIGLKVSGFVSTHDLELGELTKELPQVHNYSFESIIEGNEITFDYKIREGICQSFNACALMRQMGIDV